jgi:hypothetical protein
MMKGSRQMTLLMAVERHLRKNALSASRFGRQVSGDPRFVFDLRRGREPRPATAARVLAHIAAVPLADTAGYGRDGKGIKA